MVGVSHSVAMRITGHKTESVYCRYAIVDRKAIEEGMEKTTGSGWSRWRRAKCCR